jgi:hypothetical protein
MLGGAAASGLMIPNAAAQVARKRDDEGNVDTTLLVQPPDESLGGGYLAHSSHSSHSSHASHSSHYSGSRNSGDGDDYSAPSTGYGQQQAVAPAAPPPPPPKPAVVSFVAYPGGRIFINGRLIGVDSTGAVQLPAGDHDVRIENRFLGSQSVSVSLSEGQTGVVTLDW